MSETDRIYVKRYRFDGKVIGRGGMGVVYRAIDRLLDNHPVAFKQVSIPVENLDFSNSKGLTDEQKEVLIALNREFRVLASARHPNIISVLDYGVDKKRQPYFTMELVSGPKTFIEFGTNLPIEDKVDLLIQLLQALSYLHRRNIVHRDLKPDNVLVNKDGVLQVLDFGLAIKPEEVKQDEIAGTVAYIAPEIFKENKISPASDLFAVGLMAFELLTGQYPYNKVSTVQLIQDIVNKEPDFTILNNYVKSTFIAVKGAQKPKSSETRTFPSDKVTEDIRDTGEATVVGKPLDLGDAVTEKYEEDDDDSEDTMVLERKNVPVKKSNVSPKTDEPADEITDYLVHPEAHVMDEDPPLVTVIRRLMEKDPAKRYDNADAVILALCNAMNRPLPPESTIIRESFLQAAQFVGREKELETLLKNLPMTTPVDNHAWLIGGESGVGKSRFLDEFVTLAMIEGAAVFRGQAMSEAQSPYHIWVEPIRQLVLAVELSPDELSVLKQIVPKVDTMLGRSVDAAPTLDASAERRRLNDTIRSAFAKLTAPAILILEDIHWAQDELEPLALLAEEAKNHQLMIVASFRDNEFPDLPEKLPYMRQMAIPRLQEDEIANLSSSILGHVGENATLIEFLEKETEGNIFFIVEIVRVLAEKSGRLAQIDAKDLPEHIASTGIETVLDQHLSHVPADVYAPLEIAAVAGRFIDVKLVQAASGEQDIETWLTTCANVAVIERQDNQWRFVHDKLRTHIIGKIDDPKPLHLKVGEAIETTYPDDENYAASLAYHYRSAEVPDKEAHYARIAGQQHYRFSDYPLAQEYLARALEITSQDDRINRIDTLKALGDVEHGLSNWDRALELFREAIALLTDSDEDNKRRAALYNSLGRTLMVRREFEEAIQNFQNALNIAKEVDQTEMEGLALFNLGNLELMRLDPSKMEDADIATNYYEQGLGLFQQMNNKRYIGSSLGNLAVIASAKAVYAGMIDQFDVAEELYKRSIDILVEVGDRHAHAVSLFNLGELARNRDDSLKAKTHYEESLELAKEMHNKYFTQRNLDVLGNLAITENEYNEAIEVLSESITIRHELGDRNGNFAATINALAFSYLHTDMLDAARIQLVDATKFIQSFDDHTTKDYEWAWEHFPDVVLGHIWYYLSTGTLENAATMTVYLKS